MSDEIYKNSYEKDNSKIYYWRGFWLGAILGVGLANIIFIMVRGDTTRVVDTGQYNRLLIKYETVLCKNRGLELNTRNSEDWCMDPVTKVISEIED